jgi:hypothetical protein
LLSTQKLKKKLQEEDLKLQKELTLGGSALGTGNQSSTQTPQKSASRL